MANQRKNYPQEFKLKTISLIIKQGKPATKVASSLGIDAGNLRRWVREYKTQKELSFPGKGKQAQTPTPTGH